MISPSKNDQMLPDSFHLKISIQKTQLDLNFDKVKGTAENPAKNSDIYLGNLNGRSELVNSKNLVI